MFSVNEISASPRIIYKFYHSKVKHVPSPCVQFGQYTQFDKMTTITHIHTEVVVHINKVTHTFRLDAIIHTHKLSHDQ